MDIVERRRSNDSAQMSEARFRAIFARARVGIALVNKDGHTIDCNPALQRMLGYSSDELRRMAFYEFTHPEDIEPDTTLFRDMLAGRSEHYQIEKRYLRKGGEIMWGRLSVSLLREKEDGPAFGVAILEDITERKLANQALEEQLKFETFLADLSTRFISLSAGQLDAAIVDAQKKICECLNIDVCTLWQLSPADPDSLLLTHYCVPPVFPPVPESMDGRKDFPWCLEKLLNGESIILSRLTDAPATAARDLEGWQHYGIKSVLTFPLSTGGGEIFGALGFNAITEERGWPAELVNSLQLVAQIFANALARKRAEQALRDSNMRFGLLADSAPVLIWMSGTDKRCTYFNLPWLEFTGRTMEQDLGDGWAEGVHPEDRQRCFDTYVRAFDAREPFTMEYRLRRHDGEYRWVLDSGLPQSGTGRSFSGYIGSCIDITERKYAELELGRQRNELSHLARVAMMGELTASLAHELNQPLTAILSNVQTVLRLLDGPAPDMTEIHEILGDVVSDDQRAGEIIRGLRSLLKKGELKFEVLDLNSVILEVFDLIHSEALIKHVTVALRLTPDMPNVRGDRTQLQQVMLNLALNALDAMTDVPASERRLDIATTQIDACSVQVAMQDTGAGIAPDQIEKVFEPFFTNKSHGLGMGLAICRSIIHLHGGRIWATNNAGSGVTFRFMLPIDEDSIS